mmetsp:Transcript_11135/g.20897  ORF Transcript_11135/g.20897 Transcript_11135/m.20897 type:complete len:124 (+) Transcript_11135:166-537(+)|eukprot:CAMPEP_0201655830 /NCGR_PEP_ID=MMETSP0493-20130528/46215_1 /ASSEMBLY_ACC=CAM_ASM_000838 /TAXON_ID=420259 /ORGANISM="Thalassiosira gravida, Strain GMp14c1" /LENGTH=123 /DNA_ID=CAMNT_0048132427 /DNA_START=138 /DNA_END=509 /DNA_ORIENTATION=-
MSRTDGRKLVALAVAATVGAMSIGTIYLPFVADRDKLRGMFEEGDESIPEGARREIRAIAKAEAEEKRKLQQQQKQLVRHQGEEDMQQQQQQHEQKQEQQPQQDQQRQRASAGSMWSSFRRNS